MSDLKVNVPFTTLQTYFHRSRARMAKIMSDNDDALPEQIQIPVSLTLTSSDMRSALAEEKVSPVESKKSKRLDSLLDAVVGKVVESDAWVNGSLPPSDFAPRKLGSSKRKPKKVHRITPALTTGNESLEDCELQGWLTEQPQSGPTKSITAKSDRITMEYSKEEVMAIIRSVISDSSLDENTKKSVEAIMNGILDKSLYTDDTCLDHAFAESSTYRLEQLLNFPDRMLHKNEIDFEEVVGNESHVLCLLSELQNCECLDKIEECVNESHYPTLRKKTFRKAVAMVIRGEYNVSGAATIMVFPKSIVHPYVHRARAALRTFLPQ
ncbi:hypothetical protein LOAG_07934 [Loa loa]|uniref:DUF4806 domain-containing protein n=1 Tax=Loa loa TaxID=7209 RepID=A0A1I7VDK1_LOALO|nr:hypothetical protein LOAG_07934 [Loa loa]EFO20556.1 hypothetical protein LOAG_07934 [Loa loa]